MVLRQQDVNNEQCRRELIEEMKRQLRQKQTSNSIKVFEKDASGNIVIESMGLTAEDVLGKSQSDTVQDE